MAGLRINSRTVYCLGGIVSDVVYCVSEIPNRPTKVFASQVFQTVGGIAGNAARTISKLGANARVIGAVGNDLVGKSMLKILADEGVDVGAVKRTKGSSGQAVVLLSGDGERLIVATAPVGPKLAVEDVCRGDYEDADAILTDWRWSEAAEYLLNVYRNAGKPAVLDADVGTELTGDRLVRAASHVVFSRDGLAKFTDEPNLYAALFQAAKRTTAMVGVTDGAKGCYILDRKANEIVSIPALPVVAVDTLGAGDVFHGAFTLALAVGFSARKSALYACEVAGNKVQGYGLSKVMSSEGAMAELESQNAT